MKQKSLANNQAGAISLYVSLFVLAILVLMSLSFARIIRTGHSETVESQLNLQALSAAETGINDARARLVGMLDSFNRGLRNDAPKVIEGQTPYSFTQPSLPTGAGFGKVLALDGDRAIVAHTEATGGQVYFYEWNDTTSSWDSRGSWPDANITDGVSYGISVDIVGDCAFVGLPEYGASAGRVYGFHYNSVATTWQVNSAFLTGSTGYGASISANGNYVAIGNPAGNSNDGFVDVYEYDPSSSCNFGTSNQITPVPGAAGEFGSSVTLNNLNFLVVGAPGEGAGAFYAYQFTGGSWTPIGSVASSAAEDGFATKVAINNNKFLAVTVNNGSLTDPRGGGVYVYRHDYDVSTTTHNWTPVFEKWGDNPGDWQDADIDINNKYLALGAKNAGANGRGQIRVFEYRQGNGWGDNNTTPVPHNELREGSTSGTCSDTSHITKHACESAGETWTKLPGDMIIGANNNDEYGVAVDFGRDDTLLVGVSGFGANDEGRIEVVKVIPDPNFNRDDLLEGLIEVNCLSKETDNSANPYIYHLDQDGHVKYSCLGIDLRPDLLYFDKVYDDRSLNVLLRSIEKDNPNYVYEHMEHLDIEWVNDDRSPGDSFNAPDYPNFPQSGTWPAAASVLRVQATVLDVGCTSPATSTPPCEPMDRNMIEDNTKVFYLYPDDATGTERKNWDTPNGIEDGEIIQVKCGTENCVFSIQNIPEFVDSDNRGANNEEVAVFLRITSIYGTSSLSLRGYNVNVPRKDASNISQPISISRPIGCTSAEVEDCYRVEFKDIQAVISATGHAGHVRVRLEERVRLQSIYDQPEYAVHSASSLCKILIGDQDLGTTVGGGDYELLVNSSNPYPMNFEANLADHCKVYY
ncbi:hypothetical protein F4X86_03080 [Candidatus Saccharibacteria bacterium]|nr:hypothetical protein [Candidatus Saccharibacteria bacterium]